MNSFETNIPAEFKFCLFSMFKIQNIQYKKSSIWKFQNSEKVIPSVP